MKDAVSALESPNSHGWVVLRLNLPWLARILPLMTSPVVNVHWYILTVSQVMIGVLLMQVTTAGVLEGVLNVQIFPFGYEDVRNTYAFSGEGVYFDDSLPECGCTDASACNYDAAAAPTMAHVPIRKQDTHAIIA